MICKQTTAPRHAGVPLAKALTTYALLDTGYEPRRPPGVPLAVWRAYGTRYPGSAQRWLDQARESWPREKERRARALWCRVHPDVSEFRPINLTNYASAHGVEEMSP